MPKTRLRIGERKDIYLHRTSVENLFINEYLPDAPGDYVKVYLFCLMYAQFDQGIDTHTISMTLGVSEKMIEAAWEYWEKQGLVIITDHGEDGREIEFVRQIEQFYGRSAENADAAQPDNGEHEDGGDIVEDRFSDILDAPVSGVDQEVEDEADAIIARLINSQLREIFDKYQMMTGRTMSRQEAKKLTEAVKVYNIEPDILNFAIDYCEDLQKYSVDYIFKVALRWTEEGCRDVAQVKQMLDMHSKRNASYGHVFRALGFNRLPNPTDREIMDRWFDDMGYSLKEVLDACAAAAGLRDPNLRYVNKVLENRMLEKGGIDTRALTASDNQAIRRSDRTEVKEGEAKVSRRVLREYYDHIRAEEEKKRVSRLEEIKRSIPEYKKILDEESGINLEMISLDPSTMHRKDMLRNKRRMLDDRKKNLLIEHGYPEDYLKKHYRCDICKDTGYTDEGRICTCCRERAEEAYKWIQES